MKITVIAVGKIKEKFYSDAVAEYEKRLGRYCKLEIIQVEDERTPDKAGTSLDEVVKRKEAERILKYLREDAYVVTLEIQGNSYDSEGFAGQIEKLATQGVSHIQFVIGGSLGLHEDICKKADLAVSFSKMTFPHQLMRVILLEQIYRGYRIINKEPYHK
ncbi:MAG: 23S rRNA (pseudouridine(1915)-N(3))-methyltransferase RlmH [Lachnospiraceae bacterium]|nr:23S rRNA (pseudouridine(1915)-N(3))-methyltransferase RlmH [Lachnospiraceae bacterium]